MQVHATRHPHLEMNLQEQVTPSSTLGDAFHVHAWCLLLKIAICSS
jgi:hypothetical protein